MARFLREVLFTALLTTIVLSGYADAQSSGTFTWKKEDMTRTGTEKLKSRYEKELDMKSLLVWLDNLPKHLQEQHLPEVPPSDCGEDRCFNLFYFTTRSFDLNSNKKNILYIAGGPGQIVRPEAPRPLHVLEDDYNVVYFNLRGAGLSVIPSSNSFDKYLKADYVVEDIERLRKVVLKGQKWNAIYGYSYGTVVAQRYAHKHPNNVERLVLDAPIVRNIDFAKKRTDLALDSLENIYRLISSEPSEPCDCTEGALKITFDDGKPFEPAANNFCFLNPPKSSINTLDGRIKAIRDSLKKIYENLENEYGVLGFVAQNYDSELKDDRRYNEFFGYPKEFIFALRDLQNIGAPEKDSLKFVSQIEHWVDVALILGYYALPGEKKVCAVGKEDCMPNNLFLKFVTDESCKREDVYLNRIKSAKNNILKDPLTESQRALYVYGVNDGLHSWLFKLLNDKMPSETADICLNAEGPNEFMQKGGPEQGLLRKVMKKIGFDNVNAPCLWNPRNSKHGVRSLVFKGGADAVTAGCQAEIFFNEGLKKEGVMIEFPGGGHGLDIAFIDDSPLLLRMGPDVDKKIKVHESIIKAYKEIIGNFLKESSLEDYRKGIRSSLETLKAHLRTPDQSGNIDMTSCAS